MVTPVVFACHMVINVRRTWVVMRFQGSRIFSLMKQPNCSWSETTDDVPEIHKRWSDSSLTLWQCT